MEFVLLFIDLKCDRCARRLSAYHMHRLKKRPVNLEQCVRTTLLISVFQRFFVYSI